MSNNNMISSKLLYIYLLPNIEQILDILKENSQRYFKIDSFSFSIHTKAESLLFANNYFIYYVTDINSNDFCINVTASKEKPSRGKLFIN